MQGVSTFLNLLHFIICKFLIEDGIDSVLTNDHWQAQKHLVLYAVIALHQQSFCSLSFLLGIQSQADYKTVHYSIASQPFLAKAPLHKNLFITVIY